MSQAAATVDAKPWNRDQMAARVAQDVPEGWYVNLGIGMPTMVANHVPLSREVVIHSENGILGMGPAPKPDEINPWLSAHVVSSAICVIGSTHASQSAMTRRSSCPEPRRLPSRIAFASSGRYVPAYDSPATMIGLRAISGWSSRKLSSA